MHAEDAYLFRHALLRDAAYQLQLPGERARLHALAVDVLEDLAGGRDDLADLWAEDCFAHCTAAASTQDDAAAAQAFNARALGHALRAANYFDQNQRPPDAARFYEIAARHAAIAANVRVRCLTRLCSIRVMTGPSTSLADAARELMSCALDAQARAEALGFLALSYSIEGNTAAALETTDQALATEGLLPESEISLRLILRRASFLNRIERTSEALAALESCRAQATLQGLTRSFALWHSVWARAMAQQDPLRARDAMLKAISAFATVGDPTGHAASCGELANIEERLGNNEQAERLFQQAIRESLEIGDALHELTSRHNHAAFLMQSDRVALAIPEFQSIIAAGKERGMTRIVVGAAISLSDCLNKVNRVSEATDLLWSLRQEPMDTLEGERSKYLYYAARALHRAGRFVELASFGTEALLATFPGTESNSFNRYFTCAWTASALNKVGRNEEARELATAAMDEAVRLQLVERFHGEQRNPIFGEICAILGVREPP